MKHLTAVTDSIKTRDDLDKLIDEYREYMFSPIKKSLYTTPNEYSSSEIEMAAHVIMGETALEKTVAMLDDSVKAYCVGRDHDDIINLIDMARNKYRNQIEIAYKIADAFDDLGNKRKLSSEEYDRMLVSLHSN